MLSHVCSPQLGAKKKTKDQKTSTLRDNASKSYADCDSQCGLMKATKEQAKQIAAHCAALIDFMWMMSVSRKEFEDI